ncbi:histidinol-phosphate transaminase [Paenibacillus melissococcoides]|uniref:Histidinol-phosphate aminotransferase n=1 Tax=Paenibacillus melissococcoides TaxID=2912268 RepID=A0ABM9FYL9_9BACL|nr:MULTISPECIES: histidinol-phosphate transaminase [Paenibacillus]MEB9896595.1 histidinol-phosphate transaminase [Bacillus cereus]CAH8244350.1 histidinol-phosphate transaminase [Paenibacillus melissococcoides]CAH8703383.1 histidinol-phosphate transaminase [Paenibacillus melissococcoides]CAH8705780.1 histidinol-phosphate transaminase [Paenibacillus melissococcoides]GIO77589.1 histidinol-phosphate aminotransferase [Paenibacillus dendritiformis]
MQVSVKIPTRKEIEPLGVYVPGKPIEEVKREFGLTDIIKLASNENPYGCSKLAAQAVVREMEKCALYPEGTAPELAAKLAARLGVEPEYFIVGNGSDEIIRLLTRSYIAAGDEAIMADVTFSRYETNVRIEGGVPVTVPLIDGVHDLAGMLEAIGSRTKMIFVCNPNNPTGTIVGQSELLAFIEQVPRHILLIIDEAYYEYVSDPDYLQTVQLLASYPNLVILRTFSKIYGLAALRVGYGMMHPSIVQELVKVKEPFNSNRMAQAAALASLDDAAFAADCARRNEAARTKLVSELKQLGLSCYPSHANFLMVKLDRSGDDVFGSLLARGVVVRAGSLLGYPDTIRVSVGTEQDNEVFIEALRQILGPDGQPA